MPIRAELDLGEEFLPDLTAVKERSRDGCVCVCKDVGKRERERLKK